MGWGRQILFIGLRGGFEKHCTKASLHSDTVEDLIRISAEGSSLEDVDAIEQWFSTSGARLPGYRMGEEKKLKKKNWHFFFITKLLS